MPIVWAITRNGTPLASATLSDAQAARVSQWAISLRKGSIVQTPASNGTPAVMRDPSVAEAQQLLAGDFFTNMREESTRYFKTEAARAAVDAVVPITTT